MVEKNLDGIALDPVTLDAEKARLSAAVDAFAEKMKAELHQKVMEGRKGWDNPALRDDIYTAMLAHGAGVPLAAGSEAHIANFAMMLWHTRTHA